MLQIIKELVYLQDLFNQETEIKKLYNEEESKLNRLEFEKKQTIENKAELEFHIKELEKLLNEELGKRDEINKRINSLNEAKDKIKVARQIKSWEKEMERQEQELKAVQYQIDYNTGILIEKKNEVEKLDNKINELNKKINEINNKIEEIKEKHKDDLQKIETERAKIIKEYDIQFIEYFLSLLEKTNGHAIVEVDIDACSGCYTILPTMLQGELGPDLKKEDIDLYQCPHCARFLFYKEWLSLQ